MTTPEQTAHAALKAALEFAKQAQAMLEASDSDLTLEDCVSDLDFQFQAFTVNVQRIVDKRAKEGKR